MTSSVLDLARSVLLRPGALEDEPAFRSTLARIACTGLQWGGGVGIVGVLVLVAVHAGLLGRPVAWWYPASMAPDVFVLWDKVVVVGVCGGLVALGWAGCRLSRGRAVVAGAAVAVAGVSLVHDAYRGLLSVEYLVLVYLLAVAVVPYRPWQALLLGGVLTALFYGLGQYGVPGTAAARPALVTAGHLVRMGFATVVLTGVSALLYGTRYRQHRARRRAEQLHEQVAALERAKSRFFADVSAAFRTPLTLLTGTLREVLDEPSDEAVPPALQERLEVMTGQTRRMERLVDQLYELSTVEEGRMPLSVARHDLGGLVRPLVPPFRQWAEDGGLSFQTDCPEEGPDAWVDAERVGQILGTLLSNAIAYTPEGGTVRLQLRSAGQTAVLAVRDSGPGLSEDLRARVFGDRAGERPDGESRPAADRWIGVGVGLAHARALAERHGGRIEVETEPGFGTEFAVHLPGDRSLVADEDVVEADRAAEGGDARPSAEVDRRRAAHGVPDVPTAETDPPDDAPVVLVADDEAEMREYLRSLLRPVYRVVTVADGDAALDRLGEAQVDLVIADDAMPGGDGADLCRTIRADEQLQSLPVVLLTARPADDPPLSGLEAGADALVSKPFDPRELEARVETLIEIRRLVRNEVRVPDWMEPKDATLDADEADFLQEVSEAVDAHIDNSNFGVDWLADELDLSARHLRRRLKAVTRLSPAGFIRARRLQHAAALLQEGADTVADVADAVGYRDASYFSRLFRDTFGCSPTEYAEEDRSPSDAPGISSE